MKLYKLALTLVIIVCAFSCDEQKLQVTNHKVANLKYEFPLPNEYELVSADEVLDTLQKNYIPASPTLRDKMNTKQTHFAKNGDINNLVTITNSLARIELEKSFLNVFSQVIEEGSVKKVEGIKDYKQIEKKLLKTSNNNKALKVKYKFKDNIGERYFSFYLITTNYESFMVIDLTYSKSDIQNMIIKYLNKN